MVAPNARGRDSRRACCASQGDPGEVALRRAGQPALRRDHTPRRVLPVPGRARDPADPQRGHHGRKHSRHVGRARLGNQREEPGLARRHAGQRPAQALRAVRRERRDVAHRRRRNRRGVSRHRGPRHRRRLRSPHPGRTRSRSRHDRLPRKHDRQPRARHAIAIHRRRRQGTRQRRFIPRRYRLGQGPRPAVGRLQRRARDLRRVQPQHLADDQPRARCQLRPRQVPSLGRVGRRERVDQHRGAQPCRSTRHDRCARS